MEDGRNIVLQFDDPVRLLLILILSVIHAIFDAPLMRVAEHRALNNFQNSTAQTLLFTVQFPKYSKDHVRTPDPMLAHSSSRSLRAIDQAVLLFYDHWKYSLKIKDESSLQREMSAVSAGLVNFLVMKLYMNTFFIFCYCIHFSHPLPFQ